MKEPRRTGSGGPLQPATAGSGPLLERDYWAVIAGEDLDPKAVVSLVARRFAEFAPPSLVRFHRHGGDEELEVGEELTVNIVGAGACGVRVIHRDEGSLTIGTLKGHPEAGRITFGAYRHRSGEVLFHIRSRARSDSRFGRLGFLFAGDPMQTGTWADFVNNVAATAGAGVDGMIHVEKRHVTDEPGDEAMNGPTFIVEIE